MPLVLTSVFNREEKDTSEIKYLVARLQKWSEKIKQVILHSLNCYLYTQLLLLALPCLLFPSFFFPSCFNSLSDAEFKVRQEDCSWFLDITALK